jgi:phosphopentomutase
MKRAFVVVLDACGAGALPDAGRYGDEGANTLQHVAAAVGGLRVPTLERLGLGSIIPLAGVSRAAEPVLHGRLSPLGPGKDSTAGHWELMGVVMPQPLPVFPDGFPDEVIDLIGRRAGRGVICNQPANGVQAIERFGEEHLQSGSLIVYTSQDSVLQIAAHTDVLGPEELYELCGRLRDELPEERAVGRVIARPFSGPAGAFRRTEGRRDFSLPPPGPSYLTELQRDGVAVHTVGKVGQLFCGIGIDGQHPGPTNAQALSATTEMIAELDCGLVFTNLIETDQVHGHRHDVQGFHRALQEIDRAVERWLRMLGSEDLLVLTADHGCDPSSAGTDHTREHAPLLAIFDSHRGRRHDGRLADVGASALDWLAGRQAPDLPGRSFL